MMAVGMLLVKYYSQLCLLADLLMHVMMLGWNQRKNENGAGRLSTDCCCFACVPRPMEDNSLEKTESTYLSTYVILCSSVTLHIRGCQRYLSIK